DLSVPSQRFTVTVAWPLTPPALARTVAVTPLRFGAVYLPVLLIFPGPFTIDQVNVGGVASALPNWSRAEAVNWSVPARTTVRGAAFTLTVVSVCATVTATVLVTLSPPASVIVTRKV